ncbi:MAG TPA: hypothetical protein VKX49_12835 [Bryobacteraceae bacterium]|nr:hypothetical protein [Bryobacteraceae bacterium]
MKLLWIATLALAAFALCSCDDPTMPKAAKPCEVSDATAKAQAEAARKQAEMQIEVEKRFKDIQIATLNKCVESGGAPVMMGGNVDCKPAQKGNAQVEAGSWGFRVNPPAKGNR